MPDGTPQLHYHQPPGFAGIYRRLLLGRRARYEKGSALPPIQAHWKGAMADAARIEKYCAACGLAYDGHYPLLYPHVLTSAIHIDIISQPEFPLSPMGAVHTRIHVLQHEPIPAGAVVDIHCELAETRVLKQGVEFDITTTLTQEGKPLWESISANLIRGKKYGEPVDPSPLAQLPELGTELAETSWDVPKDMGWRYAKITGDYNPIHVSRVMARIMGFDRDLIHGMWSAARCLGQLPNLDGEGPVRADLLFKGPVYMGSSVEMKYGPGETGQAFEIYCADNPRPVVRGRIQHADAGGMLVSRPEC